MKRQTLPREQTAAFQLCMWMFAKGLTLKEAAGEIGCSIQQLSRWRCGRAKPDREHSAKIEALTSGRITVPMWDAA